MYGPVNVVTTLGLPNSYVKVTTQIRDFYPRSLFNIHSLNCQKKGQQVYKQHTEVLPNAFIGVNGNNIPMVRAFYV